MIFGTVGSHSSPFDRLVEHLEYISVSGVIDEQIIIQTGTSHYPVVHCESFEFCNRDQFSELLSQSRVVVCHGGIGTILSALRLGKQVITVPRLARLGEHNNDHQSDICEELSRRGIVRIARSREEIAEFLQRDAPITGQLQAAEVALAQLSKGLTCCVEQNFGAPLSNPPDLLVVLAGEKDRRHPVLKTFSERYPGAAVMVTGTNERFESTIEAFGRAIKCEKTDTTYEDAVATFRVAQDNRFFNLVIVTSRSHRWRAAAVFRKQFHDSGISLHFAVAEDSYVSWAHRLNILLTELIKSVAYKLRGFM